MLADGAHHLAPALPALGAQQLQRNSAQGDAVALHLGPAPAAPAQQQQYAPRLSLGLLLPQFDLSCLAPGGGGSAAAAAVGGGGGGGTSGQVPLHSLLAIPVAGLGPGGDAVVRTLSSVGQLEMSLEELHSLFNA